ncbi:MAG TPA: TolC family protein, partial [Sulfuricaulis sp.]|nr:TolC family protein [Sulfuricaulis sp.]
QVVNATHDVKASQARIEVTRRAVDLAQANLTTELALFRAEKSTAVLLYQKQTDLQEARLLEIRAEADFQEAIATLDYLTGRLLDKYGVEITAK